MVLSAIKAGIKAAREQAETDTARRFTDALRQVVSDYLDKLPDDKAIRTISRILGAEGLTNSQVKRFIDAASGERFIELYFGNGDRAVITNRKNADKAGPGW
jgi:hypothetical protein